MASTARGAHLLGAKPLHHMAGVASVSAGQAEIRGASHCHVTDSALEGEALADGTLGAAHLAAAVAAVHTELWREERNGERDNQRWQNRAIQPPVRQMSPPNPLPKRSASNLLQGGRTVSFRGLSLVSTREERNGQSTCQGTDWPDSPDG